jgi:hypothetical protein
VRHLLHGVAGAAPLVPLLISSPLAVAPALLTLSRRPCLWGQNLPKSAAAGNGNAANIDISEEDEKDQQDEHIDQPVQAKSTQAIEGCESGGEAASDADQFRLNEDLLL